MVKNLLAAVGLYVVVQKGYDFYCDYQEMKAENLRLRDAAQQIIPVSVTGGD